MELYGQTCSCALTSESITVRGNYYRYDIHKRRKVSGVVSVDLLNVLRVGFTKTYSRLMLAIPMCFGILALGIKNIPFIGDRLDMVWKLCAVACLLTIPMYWLSYRNDLEVNTTQGRYLLPRKGMEVAQIASFQREFTRLKKARQKARKST